jgi:hypothetical protein
MLDCYQILKYFQHVIYLHTCTVLKTERLLISLY